MRANYVYIDRASEGDEGGEPGDGALVAQLKQGDIQALGELFRRHRAMVYRTALAVTRDRRAADDILQESFIRLYTYAHSVDVQRPLAPWLYRVTIHLAYDWLSKKRYTLSLDGVLEWFSGLPGNFPAPDRRAEEKEMCRMVREVVAKLPPSHRVVIVLFYLEGLSVEEIAEVLELPVGTVKSRLYYARERLRDMIAHRRQVAPEVLYEFT